MTNHLTDADLDEIESHLARCQRNGAKYVSITDQRVESLLAMARRLREHEQAWGIHNGVAAETCSKGIAGIIGKWPGDETDEQVDAAMKKMG